MTGTGEGGARSGPPACLRYYSASFLRDTRLRRILTLAGHDLRLGRPRPGDGVVVWGRSPVAARGEAAAARHKVPLVRVEDAFLRSLRPGRMGEGPLGLMIDPLGVHFDASAPSTLERLLKTHPLDDSHLLRRAKDGIARLRASDLSKYNLHDPGADPPPPGYVLVIDQTHGDASVRHGGATDQTFRDMFFAAMDEHPAARIVIKTHPETALGLRPGHLGADLAQGRVSLLTAPVSPHALLEGAVAVYTVSSQMGFEAIMAGHRPRVFGQPFYAGWGLTTDEKPLPRRGRTLTRAQLFAAAMILAPVWHDPCRDRLCSFEEALDQLEAMVRAYREDREGHVALGMRMWKRPHIQAFFGGERPVIFARDAKAAKAAGRPVLIWGAGADVQAPVTRRVEDGFLRSRGLGAGLIPPLSLIADDLGIHYDPSRPSRIEALIAAPLPPGGRERAERLVARLIREGVTKYNLGGVVPAVPEGRRVLVAGQAEDDASVRLGAVGEVRTNLGLLQAARAALPDAVLIWKPHPDVEAGLRPGGVAEADLAGLADVVAAGADPAALIGLADEVWTMTSLLGFEALLRGRKVTCLGVPFYAGWGLTRDLAPVPERRLQAASGRPDIIALAHATLIAGPRCHDPVSRRPCPPEVVLDRLINGPVPPTGPLNRLLAKAQGVMAGQAWLWRRGR